jgi:glycosyltransferase involved in cell wall biosynthesis
MRTILHVIGSLEGGGAERQLAMLAVEQVRCGEEVHIALRRGGAHLDRVRSAGARIHWLGDRKHVPLVRLARLLALIRRIKPQLIQTWLPAFDVIGGVAALASDTPWIMTERSSQDLYAPSLLVAARRRIGRFASAVIANSRAGAEYWAGQRRSVWVVDNAVDVPAIEKVEALEARGPVILCVGRLSAEKDPATFVRAIALLERRHPVHAIVVGDGPLRPALRELIISLDLNDRITLEPYRQDWWGLLKAARMLVTTSRTEGRPNVLLEAIAARCPVIVTDIAAHRELVDATTSLLVPAGNPGAVASAIAATLSEPDEARHRAELAARQLSTYTVEAMAAGYERAYAGVIG